VPLRELFAAAGVGLDDDAATWAEIELKYGGYLHRERVAAARLQQMSNFVLPIDLEYCRITTISFEAREKLSAAKPRSLGEASRMSGISPSDLQGLVSEVIRLRAEARFT
jgi:tRNA uridine 5-carboxymethylaminomethyl modification enzyme